MASSSSDPVSVEAERDGVLVLVYLQGGKLWSEVEPGTTFSDWLSDQFGLDCRNWPIGLDMRTADDLDQQHEWVGATATRSGDGTLKPREALTNHAAQTHWPTGTPPPKVGNPVKVVLRPVRCRNPDGKLCAADPDRCRWYGVIPLAAGMRTTPVSRDDIRRSRPDSMKNLFYDNSDFATVRGALITALQPEHQEVTGKLRGRQINTIFD